MAVHVGYEPARNCTTGPQPGARALMAAFLGVYAAAGGTNLGIFNCRPVRGSTATTSLHGEGRACDFGINPHGAVWGGVLAELLRANSAELGIQCVIWNRRIWSGAYPHAGWRTYSGTNAHRDHIHLELTWAAARSLTAATAHRVLSRAALPAASKGALMALSDAEQRELLDTTRKLAGWLATPAFNPPGTDPAKPWSVTPGHALLNLYVGMFYGGSSTGNRSLFQHLAAAGGSQVDTAAVVAGVVDALTEHGIAAPVADELARRLSRASTSTSST